MAAIARDFGDRYYVERAYAGEPCHELWSALGEAGFIGERAQGLRGGGCGLLELAMVCDERSWPA